MSSPLRILEEGRGRRFRLEGGRRSEPKRLNPGCSNQIQGFWPERTQASYPPWNLPVTAKFGPFFRRFECGIRPSDQGFGPWNPPILPPSSIKFLSLLPDRICLTSNRLVIYDWASFSKKNVGMGRGRLSRIRIFGKVVRSSLS